MCLSGGGGDKGGNAPLELFHFHEICKSKEQAREAHHIRGVWGPSPRKSLNFRPSEIVSGAILGWNCKIQQLASQTEHIIGPPAAAPAAPTPTALDGSSVSYMPSVGSTLA